MQEQLLEYGTTDNPQSDFIVFELLHTTASQCVPSWQGSVAAYAPFDELSLFPPEAGYTCHTVNLLTCATDKQN